LSSMNVIRFYQTFREEKFNPVNYVVNL